jgi:nicotinamidase-related amidase
MVKRYNILREGSPGVEFVDEVAPREGEYIITRQRTSQFYQTKLEQTLRSLGAHTVVITGCSTDHSVSSFARDASDRDFRVIVPSDGVSPSAPQFQEPALAMIADFFGEVASTEEVIAMLGA